MLDDHLHIQLLEHVSHEDGRYSYDVGVGVELDDGEGNPLPVQDGEAQEEEGGEGGQGGQGARHPGAGHCGAG